MKRAMFSDTNITPGAWQWLLSPRSSPEYCHLFAPNGAINNGIYYGGAKLILVQGEAEPPVENERTFLELIDIDLEPAVKHSD